MNPDLEAILQEGLVEVPSDFSQRVMQRVLAQGPAAKPSPYRTRLQWAALIGGATLGVTQLLAFVFGMWSASAAL